MSKDSRINGDERAMGIEIASQSNKSRIVNGVAPLSYFQLVSNGVSNPVALAHSAYPCLYRALPIRVP